MSDTRPLWMLLDGTNYVHRDYQGAGAERAGGVMQRRLVSMAEHFRPERIAVCFDSTCRWRKEIEPTYKSNRPPRPADLQKALDDAEHAAIVEGFDVLSIDDFEADDLIATLARIGVGAGRRIVIGSADKDLHQCLIGGTVTQLLTVRRERSGLRTEYRTADGVFAKFGVRPDQWVDYRAMTGDASDNLSGVPMLGPEGAKKILQAVGSLDEFYRDCWGANLSPSYRTRLFNHKPVVMRMRRLMTLRTDCPIPEWEDVIA